MKKVVRYISEIIFSIVLIFVSYFAWDRIDVEAYEKYITQYTLEDISVSLDDEFCKLAYVSNEDSINPSILSVNNYQDKVYEANILLELKGVSEELIDNLILVINNTSYKLNDICVNQDKDIYYFLIVNVNLSEYEKKNYNLKLLVEDNYEFNSNFNFSYNILEEII